MNVGIMLEMVADGAGDRVVLGPRDGGLTAAELLTRARRVAAYFRSRDVSHVGMVDLNSEAVPIALFGAALAELPFAPVNYRLTDDKLNSIVARLSPGIVVVGADILGRLEQHDGIEVITTDELLAIAADESAEIPDDLPFVDPDDIAILLFTSGTTGEPKAAVLRHRHLFSYITGTVEFLGADPDDAQLVSVPSYHVAGVSAVLSCLYGCRRIVYLPGFDPEDWVRTVDRERITQAMVVPTMLGRVLDLLERGGETLPHLHHLSYGGGRMPIPVLERALTMLPHVDFVNAYGLTETSSTIAVLGPDDHRTAITSDDHSVRARLGSVGRPLPALDVEIRDVDGTPVGVGEAGEIWVRGEQVAGEYLGRADVMVDGWFPTKDAGSLDSDGYLYLEGRLDDVIVRGAENLSPGEIEDTLIAHPSVADVAVVGVPDTEWGEKVVAAVVAVEGEVVSEAELQAWVKERLRSSKVPAHVLVCESLPYNDTGKLLRRELRVRLAEQYGA